MRLAGVLTLEFWLSLGILLPAGFQAVGSELTVQRTLSTVVDASALHFSGGTWGTCVNGQSFQQEALVTFGEWQYAVYYDSQRRICLARRHHTSKTWGVIRFEDHRLRGNDTHNVAVVGIAPQDGSIHLAFDHHGSPLHYRVSRPGVALRPQQHAWTEDLFGPITDELEPGKPLARVTRGDNTPSTSRSWFWKGSDCRVPPKIATASTSPQRRARLPQVASSDSSWGSTE